MSWELGVFVVGALCVLGGCLVPNRWLPPLPNDKLMHAAAFAVLTFLGLRLADGAVEVALWLAGLAIAGWLVECLQQLVPDRDFSWPDIAANVAGIGAVAVLFGLHTLL